MSDDGKNKKYVMALAIVALVALMALTVFIMFAKKDEPPEVQEPDPIAIPQNKETSKQTANNKQAADNKPEEHLINPPQTVNNKQAADNKPEKHLINPPRTVSNKQGDDSTHPQDILAIPPHINLENSDGLFKKAIAELSSNLAIWFDVHNIIRKYTILINDISQNQLLYKNRMFLRMPQKMQVNQDAGEMYIATESYQRYDFLATTIASIDTRKALKLYLRFRPLFKQVYDGFSYPKGYRLEDIFMKAAAVIINTPVVDKKIKVVKHATSYKFADKKLEAMSAVEKQMLRMGAKNTQKIQAKLRQFAKAISLLDE